MVTSTIVFEPEGLREYVGGFDDWQRQRAASAPSDSSDKKQANKKGVLPKVKSAKEKPRKLKYKEKQELEKLPGQIETLESEIASLHEKMAQPDFYQQGGDAIAKTQAELKQLDEDLKAAYARWEELEEIASA